jgi:hypothetical protein
METLDANLALKSLYCHDEGDGAGSAEPYLWTVFFKIDGDTTVVDAAFTLQGAATVATTPGNRRNLPNRSVDGGESVPIPAVLGEFGTHLKPIPLQQPAGEFTEVGGVMGVIAVLMEQDNTPASAIARGHDALNQTVQDSLNALIPSLTIGHEEPTDEEIEAITRRVGDAVVKAVADGVSIWDWMGGAGNMDDRIGSEVFRFSHSELEARGASGIAIQKRFRSQGDWELLGRVTAFPLNAPTGSLRVSLSGVPSTLTNFPVRVTGPGLDRKLNTTTTITDLAPGTYTITANEFTAGRNGQTCRLYTPFNDTEQTTVTTGQITSAIVRYSSAPCGA